MKYQMPTWNRVIEWLRRQNPRGKAFTILYSREAQSFVVETFDVKEAQQK